MTHEQAVMAYCKALTQSGGVVISANVEPNAPVQIFGQTPEAELMLVLLRGPEEPEPQTEEKEAFLAFAQSHHALAKWVRVHSDLLFEAIDL